jgi:hypothetical protein
MNPSHDLRSGRRTTPEEALVGAVEIAKISRLLAQMAAAIDDPPFTAAQLLALEHALARGFREIGRQGPVAGLVARDPGGDGTKAELRRLGERLFRIGQGSGGRGAQTLTDVIAEIRRLQDDPGRPGLGAVEAAWSGIGGDGAPPPGITPE